MARLKSLTSVTILSTTGLSVWTKWRGFSIAAAPNTDIASHLAPRMKANKLKERRPISRTLVAAHTAKVEKPDECSNFYRLPVTSEENLCKLGVDWASGCTVLVTVSQLCFYDVVKERLGN